MITFKAEELLERLDAVKAGLSTRDVQEQSNCYIFMEGRVFTYNGDVACWMKSGFPQDFKAAIPASSFFLTMDKLKGETIEMEIREDLVCLKGKRRTIDFKCSTEITSPIVDMELPTKWKLLPSNFEEAVRIVQSCCLSKDEENFWLTTINIQSTFIEACDNTQLCRYKLDIPIDEPVMVKRECIKSIITYGMIKFGETSSFLHFKNANGLTMSVRKYENQYPDIADQYRVKGEVVSFPKSTILAASIASIFSAENEQNNITVSLKGNRIAITAEGITAKYREVRKMGKPVKKDLTFIISPELFKELVKQHNDFIVNDSSMMVDGGNFRYVTSLGE